MFHFQGMKRDKTKPKPYTLFFTLLLTVCMAVHTGKRSLLTTHAAAAIFPTQFSKPHVLEEHHHEESEWQKKFPQSQSVWEVKEDNTPQHLQLRKLKGNWSNKKMTCDSESSSSQQRGTPVKRKLSEQHGSQIQSSNQNIPSTQTKSQRSEAKRARKMEIETEFRILKSLIPNIANKQQINEVS